MPGASLHAVAELAPGTECSIAIIMEHVTEPSKAVIDYGTCDADKFWAELATKILDANFSDFLSTDGILASLKKGGDDIWDKIVGVSGKIIIPLVNKEFQKLMQDEILQTWVGPEACNHIVSTRSMISIS